MCNSIHGRISTNRVFFYKAALFLLDLKVLGQLSIVDIYQEEFCLTYEVQFSEQTSLYAGTLAIHSCLFPRGFGLDGIVSTCFCPYTSFFCTPVLSHLPPLSHSLSQIP